MRDEGGKAFVAGDEGIDFVLLSYEEYRRLRSGKVQEQQYSAGRTGEDQMRSALAPSQQNAVSAGSGGEELTIDDLPV